MTLRKLNESDYEAMLVLFEALDQLHVDARPDYFVPREDVYPKDAYDQTISDPECFLMGAFDEQENMTGVVRATLWNESGMVNTIKTVCLDDIYVLPECRHNGIGKKLFGEVEKWARECGAVRLDLHVWNFNEDAIKLYHSMEMVPQRYVLEKKL